jgi:hypothetical protein
VASNLADALLVSFWKSAKIAISLINLKIPTIILPRRRPDFATCDLVEMTENKIESIWYCSTKMNKNLYLERYREAIIPGFRNDYPTARLPR